MSEDSIHGKVEPGFEGVRREFLRNFSERRELGAACAVVHRGKIVVDLWGGVRDATTGAPWEQDTMVLVFSTTKGIAALTLAVAHAQGRFRYDDRVADHWPEFAQNGKAAVTIRQLLAHQAGLPTLDVKVDRALLGDLPRLAEVLARQRPSWEPGTAHAYHAITFGWYAGELLRRVDAKKRTLGQFFREEIAQKLGVEFHIGLPPSLDARVAELVDFRILDALTKGSVSFGLSASLLNPWSLGYRALRNPRVAHPSEFNQPEMRRFEIPSSNGIGEVRGIAQFYGEIAEGGARLGMGEATLAELRAFPDVPPAGRRDAILRIDVAYALGLQKPLPSFPFGTPSAFGTTGLGGSFGFADPERHLGYAYAPNRLGTNLRDDPRERALRAEVLRAVS